MAKTDLTNQRQAFVEEYVRSGDHLEAAKKAGYKDTHTLRKEHRTHNPKVEGSNPSPATKEISYFRVM